MKQHDGPTFDPLSGLLLFLGILLYVFFFASCAGWEATWQAGVRRQAESRLNNCLEVVSDFQPYRKQCIQESGAFCRDAGLESTCGSDGLYIRVAK